MIYFVQAITGGPVKIGFTLGPVDVRCKALESLYGVPLVVLHTMDGGREQERQTHARFAHLRIAASEQFRPGSDLMRFIGHPDRSCDEPAERMPVSLLSVKLPASVVESARIVAAIRGVTITDLLTGMLAAPLARMEREELEKRQASRSTSNV